ncbi:hypothetical protein Bbelb_250780 [Branchiostoma belcheri]|nr:hypothetical protein Bbelb_250780 [Branchiostoma belcheri]
MARKCGFPDLANFGEDTKWRDSSVAWRRETNFAYKYVAESCSELCSEGQQPVQVFSTDAMRLVMTEAPGDRIHIGVLGQVTAVMILNPTRPDVCVLRNLVTGNFSPVQTSNSDDLKTQCVLSVSYADVPVLTGRNL